MSGPTSWGLSLGLGLAGALVGYVIFTLGLGIGDTDILDAETTARETGALVCHDYRPATNLHRHDHLIDPAPLVHLAMSRR